MDSVIATGYIGQLVWNCQREIGVSPGEVLRVSANSLSASSPMATTTRNGCCSSTA